LVYTPIGSSNLKLPQSGYPANHSPTDGSMIRNEKNLGKGRASSWHPQRLKTANGERGIWTAEDLNLLLQHLKAGKVDRRSRFS